MHNWVDLKNVSYCRDCGLGRRRTTDTTRHTVRDWEYWSGGGWRRLHAVPKCVPNVYYIPGVWGRGKVDTGNGTQKGI